METFALVLPTLITLVGGALGALFWSRLNRIEDELRLIRHDLGNTATKEELRQIRHELTELATREEVQLLRTEVAGIRSDLTYVALAVGAKPKASEG